MIIIIILNSVIRDPNIIVLIFQSTRFHITSFCFLYISDSNAGATSFYSIHFLHILRNNFSSSDPTIRRRLWSRKGCSSIFILSHIVDTIHWLLTVLFYLYLKAFEVNEPLSIFCFDQNVGKDIEILFLPDLQKIPFTYIVVSE